MFAGGVLVIACSLLTKLLVRYKACVTCTMLSADHISL